MKKSLDNGSDSVPPVKVFIFDTNIILSDPNSHNNFEDNVVVILESSFNEIDRFKKEFTDRGATSREFVRNINELDSESNLLYYSIGESMTKTKLIFISNEEILKEIKDSALSSPKSIDVPTIEVLAEKSFDDIIFHYNKFIRQIITTTCCDRDINLDEIILVTNDKILFSKINLMSFGFRAEFYTHNQVDVEAIYEDDSKVFDVPGDLDSFFCQKVNSKINTFSNGVGSGINITLDLDSFSQLESQPFDDPFKNDLFRVLLPDTKKLRVSNREGFEQDDVLLVQLLLDFIKEEGLKCNDHFEINNYFNKRATTYMAYIKSFPMEDGSDPTTIDKMYVRVYRNPIEPFNINSKFYGITPRNYEQSIAASLMFEDDIKLLCFTGVAGTGKTLIAFAAALEMVTAPIAGYTYKKLVLVRPMEEVGKEMGALPGTVEEKMAPHLGAFGDCVDAVHAKGSKQTKGRSGLNEMIGMDIVEIQPLAFIRGRTISNAIILIDEAQNLTFAQLKALITRAGEGTKIVLCGDPDQCETTFMMKSNSGLSQLIDKMSGQKIFGHVNLKKGERSTLAAIAAKLL